MPYVIHFVVEFFAFTFCVLCIDNGFPVRSKRGYHSGCERRTGDAHIHRIVEQNVLVAICLVVSVALLAIPFDIWFGKFLSYILEIKVRFGFSLEQRNYSLSFLIPKRAKHIIIGRFHPYLI